MEPINKIFCIGLNKTGTSSLHSALKILGFKSVHYRAAGLEKNIKDIISENYKSGQDILSNIEHFDAFSDWSHPGTNILFKEFDKQYPNSKFILNTRDVESWIKSREKHLKRTPNLKKLQKQHPTNIWLKMDTEIWRQEFEDHHNSVREYFAQRPQDILEFDVTKGDGWEKLCPFLEKDIPILDFPTTNRAVDQSRKIRYYEKGSKIFR